MEPIYYLFRTERDLLARISRQIALITGEVMVIELGSGNADKSGLLLGAYSERHGRTYYTAIDINRAILGRAAANIRHSIPSVNFRGVVGTYQSGLEQVSTIGGRKLLVCLGSTVGNMHDDEIADLLSAARLALSSDDYLLVGIDLEKETALLEAAYNNQTAILTNLCVLQHINWRFGGDFNLFQFRHVAFHNKEQRRMESHLEAKVRQTIRIRELGLSFRLEKGEMIRTEIMRKVNIRDFEGMFAGHSFELAECWIDTDMPYALCLFSPMAGRATGRLQIEEVSP